MFIPSEHSTFAVAYLIQWNYNTFYIMLFIIIKHRPTTKGVCAYPHSSLELWKIPFPSLSQHLKKLNFGTNSNELGSLI